MTNIKSTKRSLLSSVVALLLCFAMLLGTTFAWFTDRVDSGYNTIIAGNLDIELYHTNQKTAKEDKVDEDTKLFTDVTYWEPGVMVWEKFDVVNKGKLDLKYQFTLNVQNATVVDGVSFADMLKVAVVDADFDYTRVNAEAIEDWQTLKSFTLPETLMVDEKDTFGVVIWWEPSDIDNQFNMNNGKTTPVGVDVGVTLIATQLNREEDGFGNPDYDKDAWMDGWKVYSAQDLQAAINAGETNLVLMDDIELDETIKVTAPTTYAMRRALNGTVLDLNGKKITSNGVTAIEVIACVATITDTVGGGSIVNKDGGSAIDVGAGATLYFKDAVIDSNTNGIYDVGGESANTIVIESGSITATEAAAAVQGDSTLTVTDGTLTGAQAVVGFDNAAISVNGGALNGELYKQDNATISVTGGTFTDEGVSGFVAAGLNAIEHNDKFVVVSEGVDKVIVTSDDLVALGGTKINGTYMLMADLDMSGKTMKSMEVSGGATVNFIGNGHTISNLKLEAALLHGMTGAGEEAAGLFDLTATATTVSLTVSDLAFENATVSCDGRAAVVVGYNPNGGTLITLNNVDVKGATVTSDTVAALVGYTTGVVNLTDCDVSNIALTGEAGRPDKVGALVGTANTGTCKVTVTNCTNNTAYNWAGRVINGASMTIDGVAYVTNTDGFNKEVENGATHILLASGEYDVINVVVKRELTIEAMDGANVKLAGVNGQSNDNASKITIKNVTIDNTLQTEGWYTGTSQNMKPCVGVWGGSYIFENCTFYVSGESKAETGVMSWWTTTDETMTFKNCTFNGGSDSARAMQIYGKYDLNVDECTFNTAKDYSIKYVGTDGRKATLTNNKVYNTKNFVQAGSAPYDGENYTIEFKNNTLANGINHIYVDNDENQTIIVDGMLYAYNANALKAILNSNATDIKVLLADGEYNNVLTASNKTIHIKGSKDAVISITQGTGSHAHMSLQNCNVTIEGVTCTFAGNYPAYINNPTMTYIDCTLKGQFYLYGDTSFIGCTFENDDEAAKTGFNYVYTYGNGNHIDVLVDNCVFNTQGHSLIMYSDHGQAGTVTMTVKDTEFHGGAGRTAGAVKNQNTAAIEIDASCGANYTLKLEGNNTFDGGFSGLWRIKAMKDGVTITVKDVDYTGNSDDVYLDGNHYTKDANSNVTLG